ncbi:MAG: hypothetical protein HOQ11_06420 [Gemmatimonadaceae bacterium]|nr:hypothetical protein [Gemmatimonadaceae bacterium]NUQ93150.1 hypothetical protein [Gemmatimonadaceae bacterium]NUR19553.1 hypothetical protein [Gemmatimonadaceae bacterium]NUS97023.1 hypothetical protein [Gemmatimonadaceae bacterium]
MASRTFIDADGVSWQVWDVHPELAERRQTDRRRGATTPANERRAAERRRRAEKRVAVRPGFENGWLAFDSPLGLRRLAPIPHSWSNLPDGALAELCRSALDGGRPRRRLIE